MTALAERRQSFPSAPISAGHARRFVEEALNDVGLGEFGYTATLLVSELVANAILHTGTAFDVVVKPGADKVRVEVHDGSPELPVRKRYSNMSGTGRGLLLVEQMAAGWGAHPTSTGKVVWFELDGQSAPSVFDIMGVEAI
jgi:anti-sigma regulatory factor (Ser/Thr protein kinase)